MEILIERTKDQNMYFDFSSGRDPGPGQTSVVDWKYQQEPPTVQATDVSATASKTEQQHKSNGTETDSEKKENEKGNLLIPISSSIHTTWTNLFKKRHVVDLSELVIYINRY